MAVRLIVAALGLGLVACGGSGPPRQHPAVDSSVDAPGDGPDHPDPPPPADDRFALAVIPDTQYLFDRDRGNAEVLAASLHWIADHAAERRIAFSASLGDIVENAGADELAQASDVYGILDRARLPYSVVAGNHDLRDQGPDDRRAAGEPYLTYFSAARTRGHPSFAGATDNGFNTAYVFRGADQDWLLLALDWRASDASIAWAQSVLDAHPQLPAIVTTHDLAYDGGGDGAAVTGDAVLSDYGRVLWDRLIRKNDQIFLTINGHFWPAARAVMKNDAGHDVHVHIANYQDRYYGGSGMIRLYDFDLTRGRLAVSTFSPWILGLPAEQRSPALDAELELVDADDQFTIPIDFAARFAAIRGVTPPPPVPAAQVVIDGTVAYWRFDAGSAGEPLPGTGVAVRDLSGHGNDLQRVTLSGGGSDSLVWSSEHDSRQPAAGSLFFNGSRTEPRFGGAYLRTADGAPLNAETFSHGYTIEAFVRVPADCCDDRHAWMGILSRMGTGGQAGRTGDDPLEPLATLAVPPGRGLQWAVFTTTSAGILTSWSHETAAATWYHVALVNDGRHTVMYVDGAPVLRNPRADSVGIATLGDFWMVGAYHYDRIVEQSFYGWLGDVRIVDRPLRPDELMIAGRSP